MKMKSTRQALKLMASVQPPSHRGGRIPTTVTLMKGHHLESLQLEDVVSLSRALLSGVAPLELSHRYGVTVEEVDVFSKTLLLHIGNQCDADQNHLRRFQLSSLPERRVNRRLFANVASYVEQREPVKDGALKLFMMSICGLGPVAAWSVDGKNAVLRIITGAKAGARHLEVCEMPNKRDGQTAFRISMASRNGDVSSNKYWVMVVTLALLRARALFRLRQVNTSKK